MKYKESIIMIPELEVLPDIKQRNRPWTEDDVKILLKYWPVKDHKEIAKVLGRTEYACSQSYKRYRQD